MGWDKGGRCVGLSTLPPSCADCLEIWEPHPPGTLWDCPGLLMGLLYTLPYVTSPMQHLDCLEK
jgi:hypothetical protein